MERVGRDHPWTSSTLDRGHPYRWRTWWRGRIPWFLINLGVADKGADCERAGGWHRWYNQDGQNSGCYHCHIVRPGQLWRDADTKKGSPADADEPSSR